MGRLKRRMSTRLVMKVRPAPILGVRVIFASNKVGDENVLVIKRVGHLIHKFTKLLRRRVGRPHEVLDVQDTIRVKVLQNITKGIFFASKDSFKSRSRWFLTWPKSSRNTIGIALVVRIVLTGKLEQLGW